MAHEKYTVALQYSTEYREYRIVLYCTYRGKCHSTIKYWVCFQNVTKCQKWSSSASLNEAITTINVIKLYLIKRLSIKISTTRTNRPKMDQKTPSEFMENLRKPGVKNRETRLNPRLKSNKSIDTLKTLTYSFISGYFFDQKP